MKTMKTKMCPRCKSGQTSTFTAYIVAEYTAGHYRSMEVCCRAGETLAARASACGIRVDSIESSSDWLDCNDCGKQWGES